MPKGLVTLESIFNSDDQFRKDKCSMTMKQKHYEPVEIFKGKLLKLGKVCTKEEQQAFILLCQEFSDIFAWEYKDLKGFDPELAQHAIELEPNAKPVRQK